MIQFIQALKQHENFQTQNKFLTDQFYAEIKQAIFEIINAHQNVIDFIDNGQDDQMSRAGRQGFHVTADIDSKTGFIYGGNDRNCGTWMDKMGDNGIPATSRHGFAIELTVLFYSICQFLTQDENVENFDISKIEVAQLNEYKNLIFANFEKYFWNSEGQFYVDCLDENLNQIKELRPNQFVAMNSFGTEGLFSFKRQAVVTALQAKMLGKLGLATLSPSDSKYSPYYEGGDNYHQGPEWLWINGCFLKQIVELAKNSTAEDSLILKREVSRYLGNHLKLMFDNTWPGLPELTNYNGENCSRSCPLQAWSNGVFLELLEIL